MNKKLLYVLVLLWTLFCPTMLLLASKAPQQAPTSGVFISTAKHLHKHKFQKLWIGSSQTSAPYSSAAYEDDAGGNILLSAVKKAMLTPNYFFVAVYAGALFLFFYFFKRKLPFCHYLASPSNHKFILQRNLRI